MFLDSKVTDNSVYPEPTSGNENPGCLEKGN